MNVPFGFTMTLGGSGTVTPPEVPRDDAPTPTADPPPDTPLANSPSTTD